MLSLPSAVSESTASTQVKIIATSNTVTRLLAGPLADLLSPTKSGVESTSRKHYISRAFFLVGSAVFLLFTFLWMEAGVRTQADVWVLRQVPTYSQDSRHVDSTQRRNWNCVRDYIYTAVCVSLFVKDSSHIAASL